MGAYNAFNCDWCGVVKVVTQCTGLDLMGFGNLMKKESSAFVSSKLAHGSIIFRIKKNIGY